MMVADQLRAAVSESDWRILQEVAALAARLNMPLYIVGGPVRDCLRRQRVTDLDLTTEGDAITLVRLAAHDLGGTLKQFDRFGTAKLVLPERVTPIDLATTRTETYAHPGALPEVTRGTIQTDLVRRDFTINAMAIRLDGEHLGELIDLHGGLPDMRKGILRVLHPRSFSDDPTRIFRGARFEQRFAFTFDEATFRSIASALPLIDRLSGDRIRHELELIFCEDQPGLALRRLAEWGVLRQIEPDWIVDDWILAHFQAQPAPYDRFTCWVWLTGRMSSQGLTRLSERVNLARDDAVDLAQVHALREAVAAIGQAPSRSALYRQLAGYHERALRAALTVIDDDVAREKIELFLNELRAVQPSIDGTRLQELGQLPGPAMGRLLEQLRDAALDGIIANPQQAEEYARQLIAREGQTP